MLLRQRSDGSTNFDLITTQVPDGEAWRIERVAFEDETSAATYVRVGVKQGSSIYWLHEKRTLSSGNLYTDPDGYWLNEREQLVVRFNGSAAGDILTALIRGARASLGKKD